MPRKLFQSIEIALVINHGYLSRHMSPFVTNGFSRHYNKDKSILILRGIRSDYNILISFVDEVP